MIKALLSKFRSSKLAKDTGTVAAGNLLRLLLQAAYFIAIARSLGPQQYGAFVAIIAMVSILVPFAGLGGPNILLKNVSRDKDLLRVYWGNGILFVIVSGCIFTLAVISLGRFVIGDHLGLSLVLIAISELLLGRIGELASFAFTALSRMRDTALLNVYISLTKLLAILILAAAKSHPTVQDWSIAYFCGSFTCFIYAFVRIQRISGITFDLALCRRELVEGSYFAFGTSAATIYNDIDKTMLARLSDLTSTGIYGAAYRIIDVSMAPIRAMTASAYSEFFRLGMEGPRATYRYARKLILHAAPYGALIFVSLFVGAPVLPLILGKSFVNSVEAVRWLALLPLIRCGHSFLGDALSGAGFQGLRTIGQVFVAVANIALNIYFIQRWTWRGAAWTSIMCDGLLLITFALILMVVRRRDSSNSISDPSIDNAATARNAV